MLLTSCSTSHPAQSSVLTRKDPVAMKSDAEKPAQSSGLTRQQLVAMKSEDDKRADRRAAKRDPLDFASWTDDSRSHYFYVGTEDGYDHVAKLWGNSRGEQGYPVFLLRVGELRIDRRHDWLTHDFSEWQEIDLAKQ
jgi:hypothetical protein